MDLLSGGLPVAMFGIVGAVIVLAALLSGVLERSRLPQVVLFVALGLALGPHGLGLLDVGLTSPTLAVIATLGLVLVLFTDALSVTFSELRSHARTAIVILGPGTLLVAAVIAAAAHLLLGVPLPHSAILGAALASTDPVLLRGILRNPDTPPAARTALRIESGMNDAVLLPIVLVAMAVIAAAGTGAARPGWMGPALEVLLLGGGAGVVVALVGIGGLQLARRRLGLQRDYESLYALGLALAAYAVGEAVHGSGYIAAFVAGITVAWLDLELCDCFFDYGQATSEMALLFTFVALGGSALWLGLGVADLRTFAFAGVALFARTLILLPLIRTASLDPASRRLVLWLGPRGLSTLLLVLLPVFAGSPGSERVFALAAFVVLLSIVVHGGVQVLVWPRPGGAGGGSAGAAVVVDQDRITFAGLDELRRRGEQVVLLDVRKDGNYAGSAMRAAGARRVPPTRPVETVSAFGLPPDAWLVSYCT